MDVGKTKSFPNVEILKLGKFNKYFSLILKAWTKILLDFDNFATAK
jgi:hypothetical protein